MDRKTRADTAGRVVIIDDDEPTRVSLRQMLQLRGYRVETFAAAEAALAWPGLQDIDCIVSDIKMPGMDGEAFLAEARHRGLSLPIVMITGHGDVAMAVRCLKGAAYDFVEKPFDDEVLLATVGRATEKSALLRERAELRRQLQTAPTALEGRYGMVGRCRLMQDLYEQIETMARTNAPVIITGETGSGKELVARAIHALSTRAEGPFVPINAGALPESTLESELFGHGRGAYTGAAGARAGKLVMASGGTLLLDEIECISERAQVQLLRVLEDGLVEPLGEDQARQVDIRLLVSTNVDLREKLESGDLRRDFYHRIDVLGIRVPTLRERIEDLSLLTSVFLRDAAVRHGVPVPELPEDTLSRMARYAWPGNVRELKHAIERMVVTARQGVAGTFLCDSEAQRESSRLLSLPATSGRLNEALESTERAVIEQCLEEHGGEIGVTATALGISRRALYERMKKYHLSRSHFRR